MTPQLLQDLLQTAVERRHHSIVGELCQFPAAEHLDTAAVRQLFFIALQHHSFYRIDQLLAELAAPQLTRHLDAKSMEELLLLAVRFESIEGVRAFCQLDTAGLVGCRHLEDLLQGVLAGRHHQMLVPGCRGFHGQCLR